MFIFAFKYTHVMYSSVLLNSYVCLKLHAIFPDDYTVKSHLDKPTEMENL